MREAITDDQQIQIATGTRIRRGDAKLRFGRRTAAGGPGHYRQPVFADLLFIRDDCPISLLTFAKTERRFQGLTLVQFHQDSNPVVFNCRRRLHAVKINPQLLPDHGIAARRHAQPHHVVLFAFRGRLPHRSPVQHRQWSRSTQQRTAENIELSESADFACSGSESGGSGERSCYSSNSLDARNSGRLRYMSCHACRPARPFLPQGPAHDDPPSQLFRSEISRA